MKALRYLRVDLLEDRRLFAGLDVRVFEDPLSARLPDAASVPAAQRVIYLDLNADGVHQAAEPIGISDIDGIARFRNLDPGTYLVRMLGSSKSQVQTTDTQPAPAGSWTGNLNATSLLGWQSDSLVWIAREESLVLLDTERGSIDQELTLGGRVLSVAMESDTHGTALLDTGIGQAELIGFDLQLGLVKQLSAYVDWKQGSLSNPSTDKEVLSIGERVFLRRSTAQGDELWEVPSQQDWDQAATLTLRLSGIDPNAALHAIGTQRLAIGESLAYGSRLTVMDLSDVAFELRAQREFSSSFRISSSSADAQRLAIETAQGIEILSTDSGLATMLVIDQAAGPSVFDVSRNVFWTLSKTDTSRLIGWTLAEGLKVFDVLFTDAGTSSNATRTRFSMGFRNDRLVGIRDGQIYQHTLSIARGVAAQVLEQIIQQVAIGIRSRGENNPPVLRPLPSLQGTEDKPTAIQTDDWASATSDSDGDTVHYILVRGGQLGTVSWNTASGGVYSPEPDANGQDQLVVQAYDGRGWSTPQTVGIQIQPINDAPRGLLYSGVLAIPEKQPGYVLGSVMIVDPDANEVFDYSVSDTRFEIVGNTLKVRGTASIPYEHPGWIDLMLLARSRTNGDTIQRPERIFIVKDPTPFHNDFNPADVDGDGIVTPLDPLVIINYLNSHGSGQIKPPGEGESHTDLDVDGDGQVSPLDILIVINALNNASADAEGETASGGATSSPTPLDLDDPLGLKKPKR